MSGDDVRALLGHVARHPQAGRCVPGGGGMKPEQIDVARCSCGAHAIVMGTVPDPRCQIHGDRGLNAWTTCEECGRKWRHAVGHDCQSGGK